MNERVDRTAWSDGLTHATVRDDQGGEQVACRLTERESAWTGTRHWSTP